MNVDTFKHLMSDKEVENRKKQYESKGFVVIAIQRVEENGTTEFMYM